MEQLGDGVSYKLLLVLLVPQITAIDHDKQHVHISAKGSSSHSACTCTHLMISNSTTSRDWTGGTHTCRDDSIVFEMVCAVSQEGVLSPFFEGGTPL